MFPVTRHNPTIPSFPLDAVFDPTGSEISRFQTAKTRWRKIARRKFFSVLASEPNLESNKKIKKKISVIGTLTDQKSLFQIKVSRKVGCVLTSNEFHFVSLADNFIVQNLLNPHFELKTKQLNAPGNYRELRETGPWMDTFVTGIQSVVSEANLTTGKLMAYLLSSSWRSSTNNSKADVFRTLPPVAVSLKILDDDFTLRTAV